jgi:SpoU rRNA methylase family enzyme
VNPVDLGAELQHGVPRANDLALVAKVLVVEHVEGALQVLGADRLAALWGVDDGRVEHHVVSQQPV